MTFVSKPRVHHPNLPLNDLGLTRRDYEGSVSTLCAGCGHDSVSAAIVATARTQRGNRAFVITTR